MCVICRATKLLIVVVVLMVVLLFSMNTVLNMQIVTSKYYSNPFSGEGEGGRGGGSKTSRQL